MAGNHETPVSFGKYNETLKIIENLILKEFKKSISYFVEFNEKIHQSIGEGLTKANEVIEKSLNEIQQNLKVASVASKRGNFSCVVSTVFKKNIKSFKKH